MISAFLARLDANGKCRDWLPRRMRSWPWFRQFYWSKEQIEEILASTEFAEMFTYDKRKP